MTTLEEKHIEFPKKISSDKNLSDEEKIDLIEKHFEQIIQILGLNISDPSIIDTPRRIAKMYVKELFWGLNEKNFPKPSLFDAGSKDQIIFIENISINSLCEHHFVPMIGKAIVGYLPNKKIIGLSKVNRIAQYFSKRSQLQERLTFQIAKSLSKILDTEDVAVYLCLQHFCVTMRGIKDKDSITKTYHLQGRFQEDKTLKDLFFKKIG